MRILDCEGNRCLNDIVLYLNQDELLELSFVLKRLADRPTIQRVHLSEVFKNRIAREITVRLDAAA